jgi:hypothetical protein
MMRRFGKQRLGLRRFEIPEGKARFKVGAQGLVARGQFGIAALIDALLLLKNELVGKPHHVLSGCGAGRRMFDDDRTEIIEDPLSVAVDGSQFHNPFHDSRDRLGRGPRLHLEICEGHFKITPELAANKDAGDSAFLDSST